MLTSQLKSSFRRLTPQQLFLFIIFLHLQIAASVTFASSTQLESFFSQSPVEAKRNHQLCYSYEDGTPGLPCNPAFLGIHRPSQGWFYGHGNNNFSYFQDIADIINGPIKTDKLLPIVNHNSNDHFQMSASLGYMSDNWGINFVPARLILFTNIRNPSLPRINVLVAKEEEAQLQVGSFIDHEWSWGLQLRGVHRRFSYNDSYLSDHLTEDLDLLYQVHTQYAIYLEPSLIYAPEDTGWNPVFSAMATNLGRADKEFAPYNFDPNVHLGASIANDFDFGKLQFGVIGQWFTGLNRERLFSGLGGTYTLSHFQIFTTVTEIEKQLGLAFNSSIFTTAFTYAEQDWNGLATSTTNALWRWDFGFYF